MSYLYSVKSDMLFESFLENLYIYVENLSFFYLICAFVSFLAVWFTWNIEPVTRTETKEETTEDSCDNVFTESSDESVPSNINNTLDRKTLMKSIKSLLTNDDRLKENEIEKKQLMDILELMKRDEKFKSTTMEELQEQLKLYRD